MREKINQKGSVYIIQFYKWFKIGSSKDPILRLNQIKGKTKLPCKFELIATFETEHYKQVEKELHVKYGKFRVNGEWFIFTKGWFEEILDTNNYNFNYIKEPIFYQTINTDLLNEMKYTKIVDLLYKDFKELVDTAAEKKIERYTFESRRSQEWNIETIHENNKLRARNEILEKKMKSIRKDTFIEVGEFLQRNASTFVI